MLLSPPGCGKSQFCKALGKETGRPVIILDVGSLMGSLVGQTEQRTRQALRIIDAMQPAIVMLDEIDKAFAGVSGSGQSDSGVSAGMLRQFPCRWLNDRESDTFLLFVLQMTSVSCRRSSLALNDSTLRSFWTFHLATKRTRSGILYVSQYQLDADQRRPKDDTMVRSRDQSLLSTVGAAGCSVDAGIAECGAGRGNGCANPSNKLRSWASWSLSRCNCRWNLPRWQNKTAPGT